MIDSSSRSLLPLLFLASIGVGCADVVEFRDSWKPASAWEAYAHSLVEMDLENSRAGRLWIESGENAISSQTVISAPYQEEGYLDPVESVAHGYRIQLERGERLVVESSVADLDGGRIFVDLFQELDRVGLPPRRIASSDSSQVLDHDITQSGWYVLRVQPELLAEGRYSLSLTTTASIFFPVSGKDSGAIRSYFGAPRDAGRRSHHGVDIFASRGTPVLSVGEGRVSRVSTGGLGGKVVWVRGTEHGESFYYAHLDEQLVRQGDRVVAGDTLGRVGNTGNARTTPPHLHFGIYQNGPSDPFPYVHEPNHVLPRIRSDLRRLGTWVRVDESEATFRAGATPRSAAIETIPRHTGMLVLGGAGSFYRVRLPDERVGYVFAESVESLTEPIEEVALTAGDVIRSSPEPDATPIDAVPESSTVSVLARYGAYVQVGTTTGRSGWVLN